MLPDSSLVTEIILLEWNLHGINVVRLPIDTGASSITESFFKQRLFDKRRRFVFSLRRDDFVCSSYEKKHLALIAN